MVTITEKQYKRLKEDSKILQALYAAGVDNWEGYEEAVGGGSSEEDESYEDIYGDSEK